MEQMINPKLGYIRDPETQNTYLPITHHSGVIGFKDAATVASSEVVNKLKLGFIWGGDIQDINDPRISLFREIGVNEQTSTIIHKINSAVLFIGLDGVHIVAEYPNFIKIKTSLAKLSIKNSGDAVLEYNPSNLFLGNKYIDISMTHSDNTETSQSSDPSNKAGLKITDGENTFYQKISTAALIDDAVDTLILNGNFN